MPIAMFRQMCWVQWRWSRDLLAFFVVAGFAMPLVIGWFYLGRVGDPSVRSLLMMGSTIGWWCLALSLMAGGAIAAQGYGMDDRVGHIYALSLPVTRARLLGMRALSALLLLTLPALGIWLGGVLTAGQVDLPVSLNAYAGSLALRALLAAWLAHSLVFALRYAAGRRSRVVFFGLLMLVVGAMLVSLVEPDARDMFSWLRDVLHSRPGPFGVLFGRWMLFDV